MIVLDEFQDTKEDEWRLARCLGQSSNLLALADPDQRIYDFRGASPVRISEFTKTFQPRIFDFSSENHRSQGCDIAGFGNDLLSGANIGRMYSDVELVLTRYYAKKDSNYPLKVKTLQRLRKCAARKRENWSVGVFVPTNKMMASVSEYFFSKKDGLPSLPHHAAVDANGPALAASFIACLLESQTLDIPINELVKCLLSYVRGRKGERPIPKADEKLADAFEGWLTTRSIRGNRRKAVLDELNWILDRCKGAKWTGIPASDWRFIQESLGAAKEERLVDLARDARFIRLLRKGAVLNHRLGEAWHLQGNYSGAMAAVGEALIQEHFSMNVSMPKGIQLMTLHKSKGKQFDEVIMSEGYHADHYLTFKDKPTDRDVERARLLLRVGVTRACYRTIILTPASKRCPLL